MQSACKVQQSYNLNSLCCILGSLKILKELRPNPPVPRAKSIMFIVNIMSFLPLEFSLYMKSIIATVVTEWLHKRRGVEGISPNRRNSQAPLEERVGADHFMKSSVG